MIINLMLSEEREQLHNYISKESKLILEAITYLDKDEVFEIKDFIADLMMNIFETKYSKVSDVFRKTICFLDTLLYKDEMKNNNNGAT